MGCGLSKNDAKIQRSTAIEIFDEEEAKQHEGVSIAECMIEGKITRIFYKGLYPKTIAVSMARRFKY